MSMQEPATAELVTSWVSDNAHPIASLDLDAETHDLLPLRDMAADADVVGLGLTDWGAHGPVALNCRVIRFLAEELAFRALAMEDDWTNALLLDEYVRTGEGDPASLIKGTWPPWQTEEFLALLKWMREFNTQHPMDPMRVFGVDIAAVSEVAYQAVIDHVRQAAPYLIEQLESHFEPLRPTGSAADHAQWWQQVTDKQPYIDHAWAAYALVAGLPAGRGRGLALQHARVIHAFYARGDVHPMAERDRAETIAWWHQYYGDKIVYWDGVAHAARGRLLTGEIDRLTAGGWLRDLPGAGVDYLSIWNGFGSGNAAGVEVPAPRPELADALFSGAGTADWYFVDLRSPASSAVRARLDAPTQIRVMGPGYSAAVDDKYRMSGGTLSGWFDVVIHTRQTDSTHPLKP